MNRTRRSAGWSVLFGVGVVVGCSDFGVEDFLLFVFFSASFLLLRVVYVSSFLCCQIARLKSQRCRTKGRSVLWSICRGGV